MSEVDSKKGVVLLGGPKLPGGSRIAKHLVQLDASRPAHMWVVLRSQRTAVWARGRRRPSTCTERA